MEGIGMRRKGVWRSAVLPMALGLLSGIGFPGCNAMFGIDEPTARTSASTNAGGSAGSQTDANAGGASGASPGGNSGNGGSSGNGGNSGSGGNPGTGGASGGTGGRGGSSGDAGVTDGSSNPDAHVAPPCDPLEKPDETRGLFVSVTRGAPGGDGSARSPLNSIMDALALARASGRSRIYLDQGTYREAVDIVDSTTGVFIEGGWQYTALVWKRICEPDVELLTLIEPDRNIGVRVTDVVHASGLQNLSVGTKAHLLSTPNDTSGASRIALFVTGAGSAFRLKGVRLFAADADHGGTASSGAPGGAGVCEGVSDCSDGVSPAQPAKAADATAQGTISATGYVPADGQPAVTPGPDGHNGTHGADAVRSDCNTGCGCGACITVHDAVERAVAGKCGCGGKGGAPGKAGRGGGASIALFVSGANAAVDVSYSLLTAGDGGSGSLGGTGGPGAAGAQGESGGFARCHLSDCINTCPSCQYGDVGVPMQAPNGGNGGKGAQGSNGGSGAGGPSYAVVTVGGARVLLDAASLLAHGGAGAGAGNAASGTAADRLSLP
jgi:hypothetical protein